MKYFICFLLLHVLICVTAEPVNSLFDNAVIPKSLRFIGTIEGKSYFADNAIEMSWWASRALCTRAGMRLATITSAAEASFLNQQSNSFPEWHWIGGRDAQTIAQFVWDDSSQVVQNPGITFRHVTGLYSCLSYHPSVGTNGQIDGVPCSREYPVLCEIAHG